MDLERGRTKFTLEDFRRRLFSPDSSSEPKKLQRKETVSSPSTDSVSPGNCQTKILKFDRRLTFQVPKLNFTPLVPVDSSSSPPGPESLKVAAPRLHEPSSKINLSLDGTCAEVNPAKAIS